MSVGSPYGDFVADSDASRPAFQFDAGHHSGLKPATLPIHFRSRWGHIRRSADRAFERLHRKHQMPAKRELTMRQKRIPPLRATVTPLWARPRIRAGSSRGGVRGDRAAGYRRCAPDIGKPGLRVDIVELYHGRALPWDQRRHVGGTLGTTAGAGEEPYLRSLGEATQGTLRRIVRRAGAPVIENDCKPFQCLSR